MTPEEVEDVVGRLEDAAQYADTRISITIRCIGRDCREAASLLRTQAERIAELELALEPFSKFDTGPAVDDGLFFLHDEHPLLGEGLGDDWKPAITVSHFRRARSVLEGKP